MKIKLIGLLIFFTVSNVFACGGDNDLTDTEIASAPYVQAVQAKIASTYNTSVKIEEIVRSENNILDLNKITVARVRCSANLINVFIKSRSDDKLLCMTTFEVNKNDDRA